MTGGKAAKRWLTKLLAVGAAMVQNPRLENFQPGSVNLFPPVLILHRQLQLVQKSHQRRCCTLPQGKRPTLRQSRLKPVKLGSTSGFVWSILRKKRNLKRTTV